MSRRAIQLWAVAASVLFVVATGMFGVGHAPPYAGNWDYRFFHAAGVCLLEGQSPYDTAALVAASERTHAEVGHGKLDGSCPFAYPPSAAPYCMALGALPYHTGRQLLLGASFLCAAAIAWMTVRMSRDENGSHSLWPAAAVMALPMTTQILWLGSSALLGSVLAIGCWWASRKNRHILAGILLGLASFKPQYALLPAVWMLLELRLRTLVIGTIVTLALFLPAFVAGGPHEIIPAWLKAVEVYHSSPDNQHGFLTVTGLNSPFVAAGITVPTAVFGALAVLLFAAAWVFRRGLSDAGLFAVFGGIYLGVLYGHDADMILMAPAIAAVVPMIRAGRWPRLALAGMALLLLVPQRLVRQPLHELEMWWLLHWRTFIVLALTLWLLGLAALRVRRSAAQTQDRYIATVGPAEPIATPVPAEP